MFHFFKKKKDSKKTIEEMNRQILLVQQSTGTLIPKFVRLHHRFRQKYPWYYNWHTKPFSKSVHWLIFFLYFLLIPLVFLSFWPRVPQTKATTYDFPRWEWSNPHPTGNTLYGVWAYDTNNIWVTGAVGNIFRSNNGSWSQEYSGTSATIYSVAGYNASNIWAVGDSGTILKYNGTSWSSQASGVAYTLRKIAAVDANTAWAVGDHDTILKTTDGGITWTGQTASEEDYHSIAAIDTNTAWTVGTNGKIFKTLNGGTTWASQTSGTNNNLNGMIAIDANTAWAVGDGGVILKTLNGGTTWTSQTSGTNNDFTNIAAIDTNTAWAVRGSSNISKTTNGGSSWTNQTTGTGGLVGIAAIDANTAWAVGTNGAVTKTTNGGSSWTSQISGALDNSINPSGIATADIDSAWTVGASGAISKTTDGGTTWVSQTSGTNNNLNDIAAVNTNTAWAVGNGGTVLKTTDGGTIWTSQTSGTSNNLLSVIAINANIAWAAGTSGTILKTTDGGTTWTSQTSGTSTDLYDVAALDANTAWVVGINSGVLKTTNGGTTWNIQYYDPSVIFSKISLVDTNTAWAQTPYSLYKTTNGGANWTVSSNLSGAYINDVAAIDANTAWVVGFDAGTGFGVTLKTTDGGTTWTGQRDISSRQLNRIAVFDSNNVWARGIDNTIIRYHSPANATATKLLVKLPGQSFADGVGISGTPNAVQAGDTVTTTIYAVDANNNLDKGNASNVGFTTTDPNDSNPAVISLTQNNTCTQNRTDPSQSNCGQGPATFSFRTTGNWTITATDTGGVLTGGTSSSITVNPGDPAKLTFSGLPSTLAAGAVSSAINVNLKDAYGNATTPGSGRTIHLSTTSSGGKFSQSASGPWTDGEKNITLSAGSSSTSFYYLDFTTGSPTITAAESPSANWTDASGTINITAGALSQSTLSVSKNSVQAGEPLTATVTLKNNEGTILPDKTIQLFSSRNTSESVPDGVSPSSAVTSTSGTASFTVTSTAVGSFVLSAYDQSDNLYLPQDQTISVSPGALGKIVLEASVNTVAAGVTFDITATLYDSYHNVATNSSGIISFSSSDANAKFAATNHTMTSAENGKYTQNVILNSIGRQNISASVSGITDTISMTVTGEPTPTPTTITSAAPSVTPSAIITSPPPTQQPQSLIETFQESPIAQKIAKTLAPIAATAATIGLLPLLVQGFPAGFHFLVSLFPAIFTAAAVRRRRKPWGIVYDSFSGKPINLAVVRVFNAENDRLVTTKVTEQNGRFNFMVSKGKYYVTVTKTSYTFPPKISKLKARQLSTRFGPQSDIYFGQPFIIGADDTNINLNIGLDPKRSTLSAVTKLLMGLKNGFDWFLIGLSYFAAPLMLLGAVFAALATVVIPSSFNLYMSGFYVLLLAAYLISGWIKATRLGLVFDAKTKAPVSQATVSIFDKEYNSIREIKTTDQFGHFAILAQKGQYYLTVHADGYKFPSKDFRSSKGEKKLGKIYLGETISNKKASFTNVSIPLDKER